MNVYDIANDLAQQIKKSEEYVNYKMAREAIKLNSKLSEEIKNFDQLRYQTQIEVMQTGKNDPEKLQKVQDKYAEPIEQNDAKRYFEADRNYTKLLLSNGIQFTFAINIGKIEELLETQVAGSNAILMRVGKSHIINKNHILQINLPKQKLLLLMQDGKPKELVISKDPLKILKETLEKEMRKPEEPKVVTE